MTSKAKLLFICNPLLDISAKVSIDLVNKYKLKPNATTMAAPEHLPLFDEIQKNYKCDYLPGGSGQNTSRIAQWLMPTQPNYVGFIGAIGKDPEGEILKSAMKMANVNALYSENETLPTGKCAVLIHENKRTLVPFLSASTKYPSSHFDSIWDQVISAEAYFIPAYFFTTNEAVIDKLWSHVKDTKKIMALSLAADFWINLVPQLYLKFLKCFNVVVGNETELDAISKLLGFATTIPLSKEDRDKCIVQFAKYPTENNMPRTVVITSGCDPITVCKYDAATNVQEFFKSNVTKIDPHEIVDTNGAGDAFAGGLMMGLCKGKELKECVEAGKYCSWVVLHHAGCAVDVPFQFS